MKEKLNIKWLVIILVLIVSLSSLGIYGWAKYMTQLKGNSSAEIARFIFNVSSNTEENMLINLAQTRSEFEQLAEVHEDYIGPGTSGGFQLEINATNSEVSIEYNIRLNVENNNNTIFPKNLIFYSDESMTNALYNENNTINLNGFIAANDKQKVKTIDIYWKWDFETGQTQADIDKSDIEDSYWIGKSISLPITVVGQQVNQDPTVNQCAVTFDANGGIIDGYGNSGKVTKTFMNDEIYGEFPTANNNGYEFVQWSTNNLLDYNNLCSGALNQDIFVDEEGYVIDSTPTGDGREWRYDLSNWYTVVESGSYVLTLEFSELATNQYSGIAVYREDCTTIVSKKIIGVAKEIISFNVSTTMQIGILAKGFDGIYRIKLEKGSTATEWVPYKIITSNSEVSRANGSTLVAQWRRGDYDGKNILNYNALLSSAIRQDITANEDGYISDETPNEDGRVWSPESANWKILLEPGWYTLTLEFSELSTNRLSQIGVYESNNRILDRFIFNSSKVIHTFRITEKCEVSILCKSFDGIYRIKLEKGTESTEWKPYE